MGSLKKTRNYWRINKAGETVLDSAFFVGMGLGDGLFSIGEGQYGEAVVSLRVYDLLIDGSNIAIPLDMNILEHVAKAYEKDSTMGTYVFACKWINSQPTKKYEDQMRKAGLWDAEMDKLRPNCNTFSKED